jgi:hypothetical protein
MMSSRAEFDSWYLAGHMQGRAGVAGFRRARRWRAFEGAPRDLSLYEIDGAHVMSSAPYLARLAEPTAGAQRNIAAFIGMRRAVCEVHGANGFADGGCAVLIPVAPLPGDEWLVRLLATTTTAWRADLDAGVFARALLVAMPGPASQKAARAVFAGARTGRSSLQHGSRPPRPSEREWATASTAEALRSAALTIGAPVLPHLVATFSAA